MTGRSPLPYKIPVDNESVHLVHCLFEDMTENQDNSARPKRRGPYNNHLSDPRLKIPKTSRWRSKNLTPREDDIDWQLSAGTVAQSGVQSGRQSDDVIDVSGSDNSSPLQVFLQQVLFI